MSDCLRKTKTVPVLGDLSNVTVQELTVAQVSEVLEETAAKDYSPHVLDVLMSHDIPVRVVMLSSSLTEEQLVSHSTSELEPLYDAVVAVNPSLAVLTERLRKIVASSLETASGNLPASL